MFTGLVEALATVAQVAPSGAGARLSLQLDVGGLILGESVAVAGACLTVSRIVAGGFIADVSAETLSVTTLGTLRQGQRVNVERAMVMGGRLGGHLVTGHVDGVATVTACAPVGEAHRVTLQPPARLMRFLAAKGSVTLDGVSLTVNRLHGPAAAAAGGRFEVMVVPHTLAQTTLANVRPGQRLNVEVDVLARYAARLMEAAGLVPSAAETTPATDDRMMDALQRGGYL